MDSEAYENKIKLFNLALEKSPDAISNLFLLRNITDPYMRATLSTCINHQRGGPFSPNFPEFLKEVAIPTMMHSLMALPLDIFSLQAFESSPCDGVYYFTEAGNPKSIKKAKTLITVRPSLQMADLSTLTQDEIVDRMLELVCGATQDMIHSIVNKILEVAPKVSFDIEDEKSVVDKIMEESSSIHDEIGRTANFVILGVNIAKALQDYITTYYDFDSLPINFKAVGYMKNRFKVYISNRHDKIIVGYRGLHPIDAGVIMAPSNIFCKPKKVNTTHSVLHNFNWEGSLTAPRPEYYRVINLKVSKKELDMHSL